MADKKVYSNEELTILVDAHEKTLENHTKSIDQMDKNYVEIKFDVRSIKETGANTNKIVNKLNDEREERLSSPGRQWSALKASFIAAIITSIGTGLGVFILSKFIK